MKTVSKNYTATIGDILSIQKDAVVLTLGSMHDPDQAIDGAHCEHRLSFDVPTLDAFIAELQRHRAALVAMGGAK